MGVTLNVAVSASVPVLVLALGSIWVVATMAVAEVGVIVAVVSVVCLLLASPHVCSVIRFILCMARLIAVQGFVCAIVILT